MGVLMVPAYDPADSWPTLGLQLAEWLQTFLVHGPGDVRGEPYGLDSEKIGVLARMYEVHPLPEDVHARSVALRRFEAEERWRRGMTVAGRRRFKRTGISVRKGWAKTELLAAVASAELHPDGPVRTIGWTLERGEYVPVGGGVRDPYIPLVAYTEEQSEELAFGAMRVMLGEGPLADDFDIGVERILVIGENGKAAGKAVSLAAAPDSRDGARTTFQGFDETHRQDTDRLRHAHETMLANIPKRLEADAHSMEVTTAYEPGKLSIAEGTHAYAQLIEKGEVDDRLLFYYHREAGDHHDLSTREGMMEAVLEASGPAAEFTDVDYIVSLGLDPNIDPRYWERVWLNRVTAASSAVFPMTRWDELGRDVEGGPIGRAIRYAELDRLTLWRPEPRSLIALGFDGSRTRDSTGLVGTDVLTGRQWVLAVWERPLDAKGRPVEDWEVPLPEVNEAVAQAFTRYEVVRFYPDPYYWETQVSEWAGTHGQVKIGKRRFDRVMPWATNRPRPMALALKAYVGGIRGGELTHDGHPVMRSHLANARKADISLLDEDGQPLHVMRKERPDSPLKIDLAMAGCLSWQAFRDVVALGARDMRSRSRQLIAY